MSPALLRTIGSDLAPIGLAELVERAALQTRVDRKYVVPLAAVGALLTALGSRARILEIDGQRSFRYESVYFDTPELTSYLLTARRRRRRFKVRTRTYVDSSECWLEVKTRVPGVPRSSAADRTRFISAPIWPRAGGSSTRF